MSRISGVIVQLIYLLLLILKQTGELIITTIVYLFSSLFATYNLIFYLISQIFIFPGKIVKFTLSTGGRIGRSVDFASTFAKASADRQDYRKNRRIIRRKLK